MHHSVCFSLYSWRLSQWAHTIQCSFVLLCLHPSWCNLNIKIPKLMEMLWSDAAVQNKSWCGKKCWLAWSQLCRPFHLSRSRPDSHKPIPLKKKKKSRFQLLVFKYVHIFAYLPVQKNYIIFINELWQWHVCWQLPAKWIFPKENLAFVPSALCISSGI